MGKVFFRKNKINESNCLNEIGNTPEGQFMLGRLKGRQNLRQRGEQTFGKITKTTIPVKKSNDPDFEAGEFFEDPMSWEPPYSHEDIYADGGCDVGKIELPKEDEKLTQRRNKFVRGVQESYDGSKTHKAKMNETSLGLRIFKNEKEVYDHMSLELDLIIKRIERLYEWLPRNMLKTHAKDVADILANIVEDTHFRLGDVQVYLDDLKRDPKDRHLCH